MLNIAEYGERVISHIAMETDRLSLGLLMDPVEAARKARTHRCDIDGERWWLCVNIHRQMFAAARTLPLHHLGDVFVTDLGTPYLVLAQQVGTWQHRALVQVAGRQVSEFLEATARGGFELSLGLAHGNESLLVSECRLPDSARRRLELSGQDRATEVSAHRLRQEACRLATRLLAPAELMTTNLASPQHVCVTIVASEELVAAARKHDARVH